MKRLSFHLSLLLCAMICCQGYLCPTPPDGVDDIPNLPPVIDSITVGVDSQGREGLWVYFSPNPLDSSNDLDSLILHRSFGDDTSFSLRWRSIPKDAKRIFDPHQQFPSEPDTVFYIYYRVTAQDTAYPPNISHPSNIDTAIICRQADLILPIADTTFYGLDKFEWEVYSLHTGFKSKLWVQKGDTVILSKPVRGGSDIIIPYFGTEAFIETSNATVGALSPGIYDWWVTINWTGLGFSAKSVASRRFEVLP